MYSSLGASDPFSALIKSECDVGRIEFLPASLPRTMSYGPDYADLHRRAAIYSFATNASCCSFKT